MNRFQLYRELRKHRHLADSRAINFAQNNVAKWIVYVVSAIMVLYLLGFAVLLSLMANSDNTYTSMEFIFAVAPILLTIDFFFRFMAQQTPAQLVRPYVLLPMSRYACIDSFIASSMFNTSNLTWFILLIPYSIMSVVFSQGIFNALAMLFVYYLLVLINSQWYLIVRTLINDKLLYWILPLLLYACIYSPLFIGDNAGWQQFLGLYSTIGGHISDGNLLTYIVFSAFLFAAIAINRRLQYRYVWKELGKTTDTTTHKIHSFTFLSRYGELGSYLQLEVKSILRNKNLRKSFIFATAIVLVMSIIITLTSVYDNNFMTNFWCIYNFFVYGSMMLIKVMCAEGNYIDCLMVRRENILTLLEAKFVFYSVLLLFPFILMLPLVFIGKWSLLMLVSYGVYTMGCQYFLLFQLAVYNSTTIPLNSKIIAKNGLESNYMQIVAQMMGFFFPLLVVSFFESLFSPTIAYICMLILGLIFIATHKLWLRNIYRRMMKKKYVLLEGFKSTR